MRGRLRLLPRLALLTAALLVATGCTSETEYGECIGVWEEKEPAYRYAYDKGNVVLAVIFSETVIVPLIVVLDDLKCPVAKVPA